MGKMKIRNALILAFCFLPVFSPSLYASSSSYADFLVQGYEAYGREDWTSAAFFLRKSAAVKENDTAEIWYMIIMSQVYLEDYENAVRDCDYFFEKFSDSELLPYVQYQKGRALHYLGQNENALILLSDFCHQHPSHAMYPSGLYWIAECFYEDFNFSAAKSIYEKIVSDFPDDSKAAGSKIRLEMIAQREREEKLLYLLKVTGEEYLSSRENYEKQLRQYQTEDTMGLRKKLQEANEKIEELEKSASMSFSETDSEKNE